MAASSLLLSGRVALVTGGGSGIGRAVCGAFAREGARVIITDVNEAAAKETIIQISDAGKHLAEVVDVTNVSSINNLLAKIKQNFSTPEILVNCAGILRDARMENMTESMFDDVIRVNLKGTFLMTQAVSKLMIESKIEEGSIINISSISGKIGNFGQSNYVASKGGVKSFTKTAARELAVHNIRCNSVMPGFIETPMIATMPEKILERMKKDIPLRRFGKPEEVAEVCVFLASRRSSYVTGASIQVSGGHSM